MSPLPATRKRAEPCLLPLPVLYAIAPGALGVVFGADGDLSLPPPWTGPVLFRVGRGSESWQQVVWCASSPEAMHILGYGTESISEMALDLRVPSVMSRLAWLCAKVLQAHTPNPAQVWIRYNDGEGLIQLMVEDRALYELDAEFFWSVDFDLDYGAFVGMMTLDLAPRIAALGAA